MTTKQNIRNFFLTNKNHEKFFEYRKEGIYIVNRGKDMNISKLYDHFSFEIIEQLDELLMEDITFKSKLIISQVKKDLELGYY